MPTIFRWRGYKFFFYSKEIGEPPHVHIIKSGKQAKFWLNKVKCAKSVGFKAHELNLLARKVEEQREQFLEAWNGFFAD